MSKKGRGDQNRRAARRGPSRGRGRGSQESWADFYTEAAIADALMAGLGFRPEEAVENQLLTALEYDPEHVEALNLMAQIRCQQGRDDEALDYLRRALESATRKGEKAEIIVEMFEAVAELYERRSRFEQAAAVYEMALGWQVRAEFLNGRGICRAETGDLDGALVDFHQAMQLAPTNQVYVNNYGYALLQAGQLERAQKVLEQAVCMDPRDERARNNLNTCRELMATARQSRRRSGPGRRPAARTHDEPRRRGGRSGRKSGASPVA